MKPTQARTHAAAKATAKAPLAPEAQPQEGLFAPPSVAGEGRARVVVENVRPCVDCGRFAIKRTVGEIVVVEADAFTDGHDAIRCVLLHRKEDAADWTEAEMTALGNDGWRASFAVSELGTYVYTVTSWVDHFHTWRHDLARRTDVADVALALRIGANLVSEAAARASGAERKQLEEHAEQLGRATPEHGKHFSTWYEMFPRSVVPEGSTHGTFEACETRLPYIANMGFDVLYLPPIHPIGSTFRKGKNNALVAQEEDPGSPWAIGAKHGGHDAIHPELGTEADLKRLVKKAADRGIDVALDIALQCSPEHPYVKNHPEWFRWRPDGTIQYAENPPKKYQDIYPIEFESDDWRALWDELRRVFLHWIDLGVRIFRIDNPHTKPFRFWEWLIGEIHAQHPDVLFLAEAFTRPKVMYHLAKLGFSQSYTYFAWRNAKWDLTEYLQELTTSDARHFFRPNFWPNTPDILTEHLQSGGPPAFKARLVLAATLAANYGIYGPAFELMEHRPREHGSEEYLDSEKYEILRLLPVT
jgi:starch synthase (maltosyl-transferring)